VLRGARATLERCKPIVMAEVIKSDPAALTAFFEGLGYGVIAEGMGINILALHADDRTRERMHRVE
jgi:hypothetical protein